MGKNWKARDRKRRKARYGMRVDGKSTKKVHLDLAWKRKQRKKK